MQLGWDQSWWSLLGHCLTGRLAPYMVALRSVRYKFSIKRALLKSHQEEHRGKLLFIPAHVLKLVVALSSASPNPFLRMRRRLATMGPVATPSGSRPKIHMRKEPESGLLGRVNGTHACVEVLRGESEIIAARRPIKPASQPPSSFRSTSSPSSPSSNLPLRALRRKERDDGGEGGRDRRRLGEPPGEALRRRRRRQAEAAALPRRPRVPLLLPHLVPRLQRGGAADLLQAGGAGQGRAASAGLRRRQAHLEGPGAPVAGGPAVRAQRRADAPALGEGRRRRGAARRRGGPGRGQGRRLPLCRRRQLT